MMRNLVVIYDTTKGFYLLVPAETSGASSFWCYQPLVFPASGASNLWCYQPLVAALI